MASTALYYHFHRTANGDPEIIKNTTTHKRLAKIRAGKPKPVAEIRLFRISGAVLIKPAAVQSRVGVTAGCNWLRKKQGKADGLDATKHGVRAAKNDRMNSGIDVWRQLNVQQQPSYVLQTNICPR